MSTPPATLSALSLELKRIGTIMEPNAADPREAYGVLNPASARSADGTLYLFPRIVAEGNYSRIAKARVLFSEDGVPSGVERLGMALEPREPYELAHRGRGGGVEDPRITFLPDLGRYVMSYTAYGQIGPRIALAVSQDLHQWQRLGLLHFAPESGADFNRYNNKDCVVFPTPVVDPDGEPSFALLHRPIYLVQHADDTVTHLLPPGIKDPRPSIWISYAPVKPVLGNIQALTRVAKHRLVTPPTFEWERNRIGAGAPPVLTEAGWLLIYHGVFKVLPITSPDESKRVVYHAGALILDRDDPRHVLLRCHHPILRPSNAVEREGIVPNVVFPTAVDIRGRQLDVYYGAADTRIRVAEANLPVDVLIAPSQPTATASSNGI